MTHGAKRKRCKKKRKQCSFEGCVNKAYHKGGVCCRHRSKSIITLTNPVLQSNAIPPSVPPHQAVDYENEEELNTWIWGSSRMPRKLGLSN